MLKGRERVEATWPITVETSARPCRKPGAGNGTTHKIVDVDTCCKMPQMSGPVGA
jgi:hypothetical protein